MTQPANRLSRLSLAAACLFLVLSGWLVSAAFAQSEATTNDQVQDSAEQSMLTVNADRDKGEPLTIQYLFLTNPYINGILLALSVLSLILLIFFWLTISSSIMAPRSLLEEVRRMVSAGDYKQAVDYCRSHQRVFAASIAQRAIENADQDQTIIMQVVESEGRRRAELIWNRISYLADIANVAPMLGLLGTVIGMIQGFDVMDMVASGVKADLLSQNIAMAMGTTMFGLIVAILALACHALAKGRATAALGEVERAVHDIADQLGGNAAATSTISRGAKA